MPVAHLAGRCVLVIEDEALIALTTQTMLHDLECEVLGVAYTAADATRMILANLHRLDLVTLDVNLNGESAAPLAGLLKANAIPFIVTTGYGETRLLDAFKGWPILQKPDFEDAPRATAVNTGRRPPPQAARQRC
jgi:CheY-like chemotaxis protein